VHSIVKGQSKWPRLPNTQVASLPTMKTGLCRWKWFVIWKCGWLIRNYRKSFYGRMLFCTVVLLPICNWAGKRTDRLEQSVQSIITGIKGWFFNSEPELLTVVCNRSKRRQGLWKKSICKGSLEPGFAFQKKYDVASYYCKAVCSD
jgi:hypothetical protein